MSSTAIALVLVAAVAHASWNLFSKQAATTGAAYFIWLMSVCITVGYAPVVALAVIIGHAHLTGLSWVFMVGTGILQAAYFLLLQIGYGLGDLSVVYPVGRGTGAMLAAVGGIVILSERPSAVTIAGMVAIIAGVVVIGLPSTARSAPSRIGAFSQAYLLRKCPNHGSGPDRSQPEPRPGQPEPRPGQPEPRPSQPEPKPAGTPEPRPSQPEPRPAGTKTAGTGSRALAAVIFALATGVFIASYTIWDKYAVADLHTPSILQGYACYPVMIAVFGPFVLRDRARLGEVWRVFRPQVLGAALLAPLAYILVLTALRFTAVSAVAPAREVSVLFGVLLGRRLLGESNLARRLAAATGIVVGIIAIAIG